VRPAGFGSRLPPYPRFYRSAEHNIDMFALARMLGADGAAAGLQAGAFVRGMWGRLPAFNQTYASGTGGEKQCDGEVPTAPAAIDAQFWNLLAGADPQPERKAASMAYAVQEAGEGNASTRGLWAKDTDLIGGASGLGKGLALEGVRFTTSGNGVQWENTASAAMAMRHYQLHFESGEAFGLGAKISAARDSIKHLIAVYGSVPASVLGGNIAAYLENDYSARYPGGSDTGIGWTYLRYPHAASTAWAGLLLLYQFDVDDAVNEDANPFATPAGTIPELDSAGTHSCLPKTAAKPAKPLHGGDSAACAAHPGCSGLRLGGDCCPTVEGMLLGCCSDDAAPPAPPPAAVIGGGDAVVSHGKPGGSLSRGEDGGRGVAECDANIACARLGLKGSCCPTSEGTMLGCC